MISYRMHGVRNARGRYGSMANEGLRAICAEENAVMAKRVQQTYRYHAPRRSGAFADSIAATPVLDPKGFSIEVTTDALRLRNWLREGTGIYGPYKGRGPNGEIVPVRAKMLAFRGRDGGMVFTRMVRGMKPNPWEDDCKTEVDVIVHEGGRRIAHRVTLGLISGPGGL